MFRVHLKDQRPNKVVILVANTQITCIYHFSDLNLPCHAEFHTIECTLERNRNQKRKKSGFSFCRSYQWFQTFLSGSPSRIMQLYIQKQTEGQETNKWSDNERHYEKWSLRTTKEGNFVSTHMPNSATFGTCWASTTQVIYMSLIPNS